MKVLSGSRHELICGCGLQRWHAPPCLGSALLAIHCGHHRRGLPTHSTRNTPSGFAEDCLLLLRCNPSRFSYVTVVAMNIACPDCGTIQSLPSLQPRVRLICRRCDKVLERTAGRSLDAALALAAATFILWFPANLGTLLTIQVLGIERSSRLGSGVLSLFAEGWILLGLVVGLQGVVLPFLRFGLLSAALAGIKLRRQGLWTGIAFRWAQRLDLWSMPDVFLLGGIIGYSRIAALIPVHIGHGGQALIVAAMLTMLNSRDARQPIGVAGNSGARRDGGGAPHRVHGMRAGCCPKKWRASAAAVLGSAMAAQAILGLRTTALIVACYPLYLVAMSFPMNVTVQLGTPQYQTIMYGVDRLVEAGFLPLAAIIFIASIMIPVTKLLVLSWLCWSVHHRSPKRLRKKTRAYRFVEEVGRWSNIDIFTIVIFLPIMQIGGFVSVHAGTAAPAFLAVIVLTMFAAKIFDPRLLWDNAQEPA